MTRLGEERTATRVGRFRWVGLCLLVVSTNLTAQVGSWSMDKAAGQSVRDSAGGRHGVLGTTEAAEKSDPTWSTTAISGKALRFDGDDLVTIPDHKRLRLTGDMTICASVYIDAFNPVHWVRVVGKNVDEQSRNYGLWYHNNTQFLFQIYGVKAFGNAAAVLPAKIQPKRWYRLVGVRKGKDLRLYVNGELLGRATMPGAPKTGPGPVTIGKAPTITSTGHKGLIDHVAIFNRALSEREIRASYGKEPKLSDEEVERRWKARAAADVLAGQRNLKAELALKPQIDAAIANGVERLLDTQLRDGSWGVYGGHVGGLGGLCAYALLKSGVAVDHPGVRRAFGYLDRVQPTNTYALACMMLAYGATGLPEHERRLQELLKLLIERQSKAGTWGYPHGAPDLSNTQYAALGLWAATCAGLKVPNPVWRRLLDGTLKHQERARRVKVEITGRTGIGTRAVAGFGYRALPPAKQSATGTMTTAGISILKICEIGLAEKIGKAARRRVQHAMQSGLNWLEVYFSVVHDQRPGHGQSTWLLYYLYGMERVGGLTRLEQFGRHFWYVPGARVVLGRQSKKDGGWGATHDTCFALLFLRRATKLGPISGGGGGLKRHVFAAGDKADDILLRGAGQQPLMLYIDGFGKPLLAKHKLYGLRILRVEYFAGTRKLGYLAADPTKAWTRDTFLHRCPALPQGTHTIEARVIAVAPDVKAGATAKTVTIRSKPMQVRIRDVFEPWMGEIGTMQAGNALRNLTYDLTASSNPKQARLAVDGAVSTGWLGAPQDAAPTLTFGFKKPVWVARLILTQPIERPADLSRVGVIHTVELWNRGRRIESIPMNKNPLAPTVHALSSARSFRSITLKVVKRTGEPGLPVGFAEVVFAGKKRK